MCYISHHHVLCHAGTPHSQGNTFLRSVGFLDCCYGPGFEYYCLNDPSTFTYWVLIFWKTEGFWICWGRYTGSVLFFETVDIDPSHFFGVLLVNCDYYRHVIERIYCNLVRVFSFWRKGPAWCWSSDYPGNFATSARIFIGLGTKNLLNVPILSSLKKTCTYSFLIWNGMHPISVAQIHWCI